MATADVLIEENLAAARAATIIGVFAEMKVRAEAVGFFLGPLSLFAALAGGDQ